MQKPYRVALNLEWTSKCNARCSMCPRDGMKENELMKPETFQAVLQHIRTEEVSRVVIAGYGEPTTHPHFDEFLMSLEAQQVRFDMVKPLMPCCRNQVTVCSSVGRASGTGDRLMPNFVFLRVRCANRIFSTTIS